MPWPALAQIKEEDKRAIIAYLRSVPPVKNRIPDPEKPGIFSYLWGKFRMLILKEQFPTPAYPLKTNTATTSNPGMSAVVSSHTSREKELRP